MASSNAWRSRNCRHSGAVMCRYVPRTMLLAASESAVTKKPRLRLTIRRSSSVSPLGFFQRAMSRDILISCGIQWLAQVARYFSQAHLYLNGTSWLTSVLPLMMRLSAARTRAAVSAAALAAAADAAIASSWPSGARGAEAPALPFAAAGEVVGVSSQFNIIGFRIRLLAGFAFFESFVAGAHGACVAHQFGFGKVGSNCRDGGAMGGVGNSI